MTGAELRIGVVLEAFPGRPLEQLLPWPRRAARFPRAAIDGATAP